jgi:putative transposase
MPDYRRPNIAGGTYFFTVTLADRSSDLLVRYIELLRASYRTTRERRPFETIAICVLPDHLHAIWWLPEGDADFPTRWSAIKREFSRHLPEPSSRSASKRRRREKGIWQRRYWEHVIRDDNDLARHVDYIHYNPVKHRLVTAVRDWPHSSFHQHVSRRLLPPDWGGDAKELAGSYGE